MAKPVRAITAKKDMEGPILDGGYSVDVECLPPGFPWRDSRWENDDRGIDVPNVSGSVWCRVFETGGEVPVGYAIFAGDESAVRCDDAHVDDAHRRHGIADQLYQLAACLFDAPVVPSQRLLDDGVLFWGARTENLCPPQGKDEEASGGA